MSQLDTVCANLNKQMGAELLRKGAIFNDIPKIPFSSYRLNHMTYGGFPRGYMAEFYGDGGGGKTTTALDLLANAQKLFKKEYAEQIAKLEEIKNPNKQQKEQYAKLKSRGYQKCVFLDAETSFDAEWATKIGVDVDDLYILTPENQSGEDILQIALNLCETGEVGLVILDSIGALYSDLEAEKNLNEKVYCGIAGALTRFSKKMTRLASQYNISVIMINQVREDIDAQYGTRLKTTGGKGFKHHCALRIMFMKGPYLDAKNAQLTSGCEEPAGNIVKVHIEKTKKFAPNRKEGFYTLNYTTGIDKVADLIDICVLKGIIVRAGAYYSILDENNNILEDENGSALKFQGKSSLQEFIQDVEVIYNYLIERLN
jgi:recombination protein RecA